MKTLLEILNLSSDYLNKTGIESPRREAEILLSDYFSMNRTEIYLNFDRPLEEKEIVDLRERVKRRGAKEPSAYIHGSVSFFGLNLSLNPSVLIPRQETEILVDLIVKDLKKKEMKGKTFLDLCCGSGCVGLAIKKHLPELEVILSDISPEAILVAKENALKNQVEVHFLQGDLLEPLKGRKVDFIACNPPYISEEEFTLLSPEVSLFEPKTALVSGSSGLEFYSRLEKEIPKVLEPSGKIWFEIGATQGKAVLDLFSGQNWKNVACLKDWAGHDRFVTVLF